MAAVRTVLASLVLACSAQACYGNVLFSSLQRTLIVSASPQPGQVVKAGEDKITVTWRFNQSFAAGTDSAYKTVSVKLCYAPISQVDRSWRKTVDNLAKDKTCQHAIAAKPYSPSNQSAEWLVQKDVPEATYFVRAYALDAAGVQVGFGQTTNKNKTTDLFVVQAITGRHPSLDIASVCFSAFSVVSLIGFFIVEKRKANKAGSAPN
ncbi:hypothetical protein NL676_028715 [Syzygium grande]|nr:hypothetical protein NL676_028715 [Syzygium grande]